MKLYKILCVAGMILSANANGQTTITMGLTTQQPNVDSGNAGFLLAQNAVLAQNGTLQSLSFYINTVSGSLELGLYDSNGPNGTPGNLLYQSASFTPVAGWNTVTVSSQITLTSGNYWLAYEVSSNNMKFLSDYNHPPAVAYAEQGFGAMPVSFPANPTLAQGPWSFYATLTASPVPTPTPTPAPTPTPTPAPSPTPSPTPSSSLTLAWNPPSTIAGYKLFYSTSASGPYTVIDVGLNYQYTVTGLTSGTTYYWFAESYDANGILSCATSQLSAVAP